VETQKEGENSLKYRMNATAICGKSDLRIRDFEVSEARGREVVIKVMSCGVCPTSIPIIENPDRPHPHRGALNYVGVPGLPGHEVAGEIVDVGEEVSEFQVGERVVPILCRNGFAQYFKSSELGYVRIPEGVEFDEACFAEPLACCLSGQLKFQIKPGDDVLVIGAGQIGLLHMQLAKASGARVIVSDQIDGRLRFAEKMGAMETINPLKENAEERISELTDGKRADAVIVAAASKTAIEQGLRMVAFRGNFHIFAAIWPAVKIETDPNIIHYNETVITASYACDEGTRIDLFRRALKLIKLGIVNTGDLVTHRLPLEKTYKAHMMIKSREGFKVIIKPWMKT